MFKFVLIIAIQWFAVLALISAVFAGELSSPSSVGLQDAITLYRAGRYANAKEICINSACRNPGSYAAYYMLGNIELRLGNLREAKIHYRWCQELDPDSTTDRRCDQAVAYIDGRLAVPRSTFTPSVHPMDCYNDLKIRLFNSDLERSTNLSKLGADKEDMRMSGGLISQIDSPTVHSKIKLSPWGTNQYIRNYFIVK